MTAGGSISTDLKPARVVITGATGMIGRGVLLECLESPLIDSILAINRSPIGLSHDKLTELLIPNFFDLSTVSDHLTGYDGCFFCLGISSVGKTEADYRKITHDLTLNFAQALVQKSPQATFCYLSAAGADSEEKSRMMWARVRGETENALRAMPFKAVYIFRPGLIQPKKGVRSKTKIYDATYFLLRPVFSILTSFPKLATDTEKFGLAVINAAVVGFEKPILENYEINQMAGR